MKRFYALAIAMILWTFSGHAQMRRFGPVPPDDHIDDYIVVDNSIRFAPEVGYNINSIARSSGNDLITSHSYLSGWHGGIMIDCPVEDNFSVQPALRYIMKGGEVSGVFNLVNLDRTVYTTIRPLLHYIEMPVDFTYKFGRPGCVRFMAGAGSYIAFMVGASNEGTIRVTTLDGVYIAHNNFSRHDLDIHDDGENVDKFDAGCQAFIGVESRSGWFAKLGTSVGFGILREYHVALNTNNPNSLPVQETDDLFDSHNYNFYFTIGCLFW